MIADKLFFAGVARVILGAVAFLAVPYCVGTMTVGAIEFYGDLHSFMVSLFALTCFPASSYFLHHHSKLITIFHFSITKNRNPSFSTPQTQ
jgi:hypothetical protein